MNTSVLNTEDHAILLAVNRYPGLSSLQGPENDAKAFRDWLVSPEGGAVPDTQVISILSSDPPTPSDLYDEHPTVRDFHRALDKLTLDAQRQFKARAGRRLYLFLAGHGFTAGAIKNDPALFTAEAQAYDAVHIAAPRYATRMADAGLFDEIVLVMDCCQDFFFTKEVMNPTWMPPARNMTNQVKVFQAFGAPRGQAAFEDAAQPGGPVRGNFSRIWCEALATAEADENGWVTSETVRRRALRLWKDSGLQEKTGNVPPIDLPSDEIRFYRKGAPPQAPQSPQPVGTTSLPRVGRGGPRAGTTRQRIEEDLEKLSSMEFRTMDKAMPRVGGQPPVALRRGAVRIEAQDELATIEVLDKHLHTVGGGLATLELQLPVGRYTARFRLGDALLDEAFQVLSDPVVVRCPDRLRFSSPAPLPDTSTTHEYHAGPAGALLQASRLASATAWTAGQLLVFVRASQHRPHEWDMTLEDAMNRLMLRDAQYQPWALDHEDSHNMQGWRFWCATPPAGACWLSWRERDAPDARSVDVPVQVIDGQTTMVFVDAEVRQTPRMPGEPLVRLRLQDAAVSHWPHTQLPDLQTPQMRLLDSLRTALVTPWSPWPQAALAQAGQIARLSPQAAVYAIGLCLRQAKVDWQQVLEFAQAGLSLSRDQAPPLSAAARRAPFAPVPGLPDLKALVAIAERELGRPLSIDLPLSEPPQMAFVWDLAEHWATGELLDTPLCRLETHLRVSGGLLAAFVRPAGWRLPDEATLQAERPLAAPEDWPALVPALKRLGPEMTPLQGVIRGRVIAQLAEHGRLRAEQLALQGRIDEVDIRHALNGLYRLASETAPPPATAMVMTAD